ncbi:hypothetical protein CPB83DRAFT_856157 [Crepidotus variabilis]|uniref:LIM zinc-binding domain-containing protein n=1 Tax=Crepidotus variabilis TaxID=179855 RepID=A0A9P6EEH7_9AGAR|nr:hypothetical protein CPB83DRAFT_856157 [Crepidotus variabilis]
MTTVHQTRGDNRQRTVLDLHRKHAIVQGEALESMVSDDHRCPACELPVGGKKGGLAIANGPSFFHIDCYKCKKCSIRIQMEENVFQDLDGLLLCWRCLHVCKACTFPIAQNIVYAEGPSHYHSECFRCRRCYDHLDEDHFAQTSRSVYCIPCFEKRQAKMKKMGERSMNGDIEPAFAL